MNKKALIIGGSAIAVVAVVVALILIFTGSSDAYRSIKVFEIDGTCKVDRDGDSLDAFKNMALSSGDTLTVGEGSFARLKLDDDKYVYLEANTKINLTATGTANDSKTMVYIERGSMLTEVKKKLSATSSYDIVTPNTTMSIRGTKTLTEVYEDVLGAIKTSAAVVEGQVKFSTIQKDKTGKAVIVSTDLTVGQGYGVTTESKDLLSEDDVKHIADDGKTVDGQTAEETTHEELGSVLETPAFSDEFLTNIVAVLARSREEDIEEGFTAEDITEEELNAAINILNDVIEGKVELPAFVEEYIVSQSQPYYSEPVVVDTPVTNDVTDTGADQTVDTEPVIADDPIVADEAEEGDDTFIVDGTGETLVGIDDADDTDDAVTEDDKSDDQTDDADETDDADDETGDDESDEADEADETGDDESDEADEADEDDNAGEEDEADSDDESDEDDEEEAVDEGSAEEEEQPDESENNSDTQSSEPTPTQDPNANDVRDPNGGGGETSETHETIEAAQYSDTFWEISETTASSSTGWRVDLKFRDSNQNVLSVSDLPTTKGAALPAASSGSSGGTGGITVTVETSNTCPSNYTYEFAGWYSSSTAADNLNPEYLLTEVPETGTIYPGIRRTITGTIYICHDFRKDAFDFADSHYQIGLRYYGANHTEIGIDGLSAAISSLSPGTLLPGYKTYDGSADVSIDEDAFNAQTESWAESSVMENYDRYYAFTGWYSSEEAARTSDQRYRITNVASTPQELPIDIYAGIDLITIVRIPSTQTAHVVVPTGWNPQGTDAIVDYEVNSEHVDFYVISGKNVILPDEASGTTDHDYPYIAKESGVGRYTQFYCYMDSSEFDEAGIDPYSYVLEQCLREDTYSQITPYSSSSSEVRTLRLYYPENNSFGNFTCRTGLDENNVHSLDMIFSSPVKVRIAVGGSNYLSRFTIHENNNDVYNDVTDLDVFISGALQEPVRLPGANERGQLWHVTEAQNYVYTLETVYFDHFASSHPFTLPFVKYQGVASGGGYDKLMLCSYKTSRDGLVTTFLADDSDPSHVITFTGDNSGSSPMSITDTSTDGRFIATMQLVDWVSLDLTVDSRFLEKNYVFSIGENNPYVIPMDAYGSGQVPPPVYALAVNPKDLYKEQNTEPAFPYNVTVQTAKFDSSTSHDVTIFAPDDVIYPWNSAGQKRTGVSVNNPQTVFNAMDENIRKSYSFVGVEGYRLSGFDVSIYYNNNNTKEFRLNETEDGIKWTAAPCTDQSGNSCGSVLPLDDLAPIGTYLVTVKPVFTPVRSVTASLQYVSPQISPSSYYGGYRSQTNFSQTANDGFMLKLEGFYGDDTGTVDIESLKLDYCIIDSAENSITPFIEQNISSVLEKESSWNYSNPYGVGAYAHDPTSSGGVMICKLREMAVNKSSSELGEKAFIRGLAKTPVTYSTYCPGKIDVEVASGQEKKYSCFVYTDNNVKKIGRVFDNTETFTVADAAFPKPAFTGMMWDFVGVDQYMISVYGGNIKPYYRGNELWAGGDDYRTAYTTETGLLISGMDLNRFYLTSEFMPGSSQTILSYILGNFSVGGAGIFEYRPYRCVTIKNCDTAHAYSYSQTNPAWVGSYSGLSSDTSVRLFSPVLGSDTSFNRYELKNVTGKEESYNLNLYAPTDDIGPDNFITYWPGGSSFYLFYVGKDDYVVYSGDEQTSENAKDYAVQYEFGFEPVT